MKELRTIADVADFQVSPNRLHSATHEEIIAGATTDVYFVKTHEILKDMDKASTEVTAEIFASRAGLMCGTEEALELLKGHELEVWAVPEGETFKAGDVVMRIKGPYALFGIYETALLGILASACGWATAARECRDAAGDKMAICFGARHIHPAVAPVMERASLVGGMDAVSCILAAKLKGREPIGTLPHAIFLIVGDTLPVAKAYHAVMPPNEKRIILVDTFKDEVEETLRVAEALGNDLFGIRVDTPEERGGVTPGLVRELRARLDQKGYGHVQIVVSGGLTPDRLPALIAAGADVFGIGAYIANGRAINMTMDIKEVEGRPVAKRGRIPGQISNPKLQKVL